MDIKITFDSEAAEILKNKKAANEAILLDLDDGVGMFSKVGQCSLDTSFRILLVEKDIDFKSDYSVEIDSNIDPIYIKASSDYIFTENITFRVRPNSQTLQMSSSAGLIDGTVNVEHIKKEEV
ncbi:hypothetical protein RD055328_11670 [Companilactobacillus sp. RD055328]|uniref:iron-sulfur cluster biosynthesis family protein n=1 Tax=Companilactobacillus sp. RD055328 TaxID=2916634 RepID=UPI001FC7E42A|nr:iron-sulfur cluster biosynthesis family protein [Companilactobacillus sp. RD055328]GKQ43244.1 hypothetical protein RD055328_11670 [Companilactobacillus sp. RD055328]